VYQKQTNIIKSEGNSNQLDSLTIGARMDILHKQTGSEIRIRTPNPRRKALCSFDQNCFSITELTFFQEAKIARHEPFKES
jgi:hypothetical protein